jgi:hypothetical protein
MVNADGDFCLATQFEIGVTETSGRRLRILERQKSLSLNHSQDSIYVFAAAAKKWPVLFPLSIS